jgi:hypothetical protein
MGCQEQPRKGAPSASLRQCISSRRVDACRLRAAAGFVARGEQRQPAACDKALRGTRLRFTGSGGRGCQQRRARQRARRTQQRRGRSRLRDSRA